jgi:hypothetical protein
MGRAGPVFAKIRPQTGQRRATRAACRVEAPRIGSALGHAGKARAQGRSLRAAKVRHYKFLLMPQKSPIVIA